jgi:hypothetical protein
MAGGALCVEKASKKRGGQSRVISSSRALINVHVLFCDELRDENMIYGNVSECLSDKTQIRRVLPYRTLFFVVIEAPTSIRVRHRADPKVG